MAAISNRMPPIAVEYDGPRAGERRTKNFEGTPAGARAARRFYKEKLNKGKHPSLKKVDS